MKFRYNYTVGEKIGELFFVKRTPSQHSQPMAIFKCRCGKEFETRILQAKKLVTKSCGCISRQLVIEAQTRHLPVSFHESGIKKIPFFSSESEHKFWNKVAITANQNKCWLWQGCHGRYGAVRIGKGMYKANRVSYALFYKKDPADLHVLHSCDNPMCCNPNHLSLGTHADNMGDMALKGRADKKKLIINK